MFGDPIDAERGRLRPAERRAENGVRYGGLVLAIAGPISAGDAAIAQWSIPYIVGVALNLCGQVVRSPVRRRDEGFWAGISAGVSKALFFDGVLQQDSRFPRPRDTHRGYGPTGGWQGWHCLSGGTRLHGAIPRSH
jgi:hypothetical protein